MNRTEFMDQLEGLLQNISLAERQEALQYYNDYFDDAGAENENEVLEALGSPARVAENIRRELSENQGAKGLAAADKAMVEYGRTGPAGPGQEPGNVSDTWERQENRNYGTGVPEGSASRGTGTGSAGKAGTDGQSGMSGGAIALIVVLAVFASPFLIGLLCVLFGILMAWFALILSFGAAALSLFLALFILLIVGGMCIPVDPLAGVGLMGGGMICGGVGLLFLMLTVAMAGIVTPAIFKGMGHLFRLGRKGDRA